jgi:hypothetical protein
MNHPLYPSQAVHIRQGISVYRQEVSEFSRSNGAQLASKFTGIRCVPNLFQDSRASKKSSTVRPALAINARNVPRATSG